MGPLRAMRAPETLESCSDSAVRKAAELTAMGRIKTRLTRASTLTARIRMVFFIPDPRGLCANKPFERLCCLGHRLINQRQLYRRGGSNSLTTLLTGNSRSRRAFVSSRFCRWRWWKSWKIQRAVSVALDRSRLSTLVRRASASCAKPLGAE